MGNDGGSIPKRRELVKEAARNPTATELRESQHEQQEYCWTTDPISQKPLAQPIVSDSAGKLYNKDTILEYLVEGARKDEAENATQGSIKSLKDVVEVKFTVNADATTKIAREAWVCPVTGDKLGPGSKAVYLVPCGHAFSATAIKEVSGERCLTCETEYASNDIIPILPAVATDIARLSLRVKTLQEKGLTHSLKKASGGGKKRKKKDELSQTTHYAATPVRDAPAATENAGIKNIATASLTAKVLEEQERIKKRRLESGTVRSLFSSRNQNEQHANKTDFMTRGYSVPSTAKR
ncbi:hypothetical protein BAUCODRAFT_76874 [Baudoinia panamericana UAMH 10762]|uniref:Uncharacterized protein n=1 Tax=Baudoinia panamericana (strain UAMH 10762) TaxID=717646 RepID=M2MNF0_BAUPA|nr:uncharacterized protein BAUCODRAFT_76874 [Baudoinia panamericana UAMH 10762]EMC92973.1 hypothetical protein BAUCODRAFT_76874 [Baudoinia panamericana UAMH 10762]